MAAKRSYRSTLREEQAAATRVRIRSSARSLFEARGFSGATVAEIASAAGVSAQTVYAVFGGKPGIVGAMLEELEESIGLDSWVARMLTEPDARRQLRLFISFNREMYESGSTILRAMVAGQGSTEVKQLIDRGNDERRKGTLELMESIAAKGALRPGIEPKEGAELLWLLTSAEQFLHATDTLGWTGERYEGWLGDLLERELFAPAPSDRRD